MANKERMKNKMEIYEQKYPELAPLFDALKSYPGYDKLANSVINTWDSELKNGSDKNIIMAKISCALVDLIIKPGTDISQSFEFYYDLYKNNNDIRILKDRFIDRYDSILKERIQQNMFFLRLKDATDDLAASVFGGLHDKNIIPTPVKQVYYQPANLSLLSPKEKLDKVFSGALTLPQVTSGYSVFSQEKVATLKFNFSKGINNRYLPGSSYENVGTKTYEPETTESLKIDVDGKTENVQIHIGMPDERTKKYDPETYMQTYLYHIAFDLFGNYDVYSDLKYFDYDMKIENSEPIFIVKAPTGEKTEEQELRQEFWNRFKDPNFRRWIYGVSMFGRSYVDILDEYCLDNYGSKNYWEYFFEHSDDPNKLLTTILDNAKLRYPEHLIDKTLANDEILDKSKVRISEIQNNVLNVYEDYLDGKKTVNDVLGAIRGLSFMDNKLYNEISSWFNSHKGKYALGAVMIALVVGVTAKKEGDERITAGEFVDIMKHDSHVNAGYLKYNSSVHAKSFIGGVNILISVEDFLRKEKMSFNEMLMYLQSSECKGECARIINGLTKILYPYAKKNNQIKRTSEKEFRESLLNMRKSFMFPLMIMGFGGRLGLDYSMIARFDDTFKGFWEAGAGKNLRNAVQKKDSAIKGFYVPEIKFLNLSPEASYRISLNVDNLRYSWNKKENDMIKDGKISAENTVLFEKPNLKINFVTYKDKEGKTVRKIGNEEFIVIMNIDTGYDAKYSHIDKKGELKSEDIKGGLAPYTWALVTIRDENGNAVGVPQTTMSDSNGVVEVKFDVSKLKDGHVYKVYGIPIRHDILDPSVAVPPDKEELLGYITVGETEQVIEVSSAEVPPTVQKIDIDYAVASGDIGSYYISVWGGEGDPWNPEHPTDPNYVSPDEFKEAISNMAQSAVLGNVPEFSDDARDYFIDYAQIVRRVLARYSGSEHQDWVDEFDDVIDQVRNGTLSPFDAYERIFNTDPSTGYSANLPRGIDTLDAAVGGFTKGKTLLSFIPGMGYSAKFSYNSIKALYSDKPISLYEASISIGKQQYIPVILDGNELNDLSVWCKSIGAEVHFKVLPFAAIIGLRAMFREALPKVTFDDLVSKGLEGAVENKNIQSDVSAVYRPLKWRLQKKGLNVGVSGLYFGERRTIKENGEWRLTGQEIGANKSYYGGLSLYIKSDGFVTSVTGEYSPLSKPTVMASTSIGMGKGWNLALKASNYSQTNMIYSGFEIGKDKIYGVNAKLSVGTFYDIGSKQIRGPNVKLEIEF